MAVCASFLSQLEVYNESVGLLAKTNTQQHRCLLFPISNFLGSSLILKIATLLNNPTLCQLADEETPTSTSANLEGSASGPIDDEVEDYNNIFSMYNRFHRFQKCSLWKIKLQIQYRKDALLFPSSSYKVSFHCFPDSGVMSHTLTRVAAAYFSFL